MKKIAIITGADGDMGREITKAVAKAGYLTIMACYPNKKLESICHEMSYKTKGEVIYGDLDLADVDSIDRFVASVKEKFNQVDLLINNAGTLYPKNKTLDEKWDYTIMVNYFGHYLLTQKLLPLLNENARIVTVCSLTYRYGKIYPQMFDCGRNSWVQQVRNYSNSKLALLYFSLDLAEQLKEKNIAVNCSDPGIVGTKIIAMNNWLFDKFCAVFVRPFMKSPKNGAKTAIYLALNEEMGKISGGYFKNEKQIPVISRFLQSNERELLRELTANLIHEKNISL
jgi:NAD(P)-dependent dehydrogenase (short-subunit alcohol dehydrogenase family)